MESGGEKNQATWPTTVATPFHLHLVLAIGFIVVFALFEYQLAALRHDNESLKSQVELLTLQIQVTLMKGGQNVADDSAYTQYSELGQSSSLTRDLSRQRRSTGVRTNSTRNRPSHRRIVAAQFSIESERLTEAQTAERIHGHTVNYTGPNLKWHETGLSWPTRNHLDADHTSVTVAEDGIYLIYAQLTYYNAAAKSSFRVETDSRTLLKCFQSVDTVSEPISGTDSHRVKTCHSSGLFTLKLGEKLRLVNQSSRAIVIDKHANFWGLIKLHDPIDS